MKAYFLPLINVVLVSIAFLTTAYSYDHYGDAGCQGGLCGIAVFIHALPLLLVWILEIIAFNLSLKGKWYTLICLAISFVITTLVYKVDYGFELKALDLEPEILYFLAGTCLAIYVWVDFKGITEENDKLFHEKMQLETIHPVLYSAFAFWLFCNVCSYFKNRNSADYHHEALLVDLIVIVFYSVLMGFIFKKHSWPLYVFFVLLLYRTGAIIYYNAHHIVEFISIGLLISNLCLMLGIVVQYLRIKKGNITGDSGTK